MAAFSDEVTTMATLLQREGAGKHHPSLGLSATHAHATLTVAAIEMVLSEGD